MARTVRAYIGPCLCEHVAHFPDTAAACYGTARTFKHAHHASGARKLLTHHVRQISADVCAPCAASIAEAFPEEVTPL